MTTGHELALALRAAYLAMHRQADDALARFGVTADQFVLLAALADADALSQQDLVRRISSDASTVRAMLVLLERRGFVDRPPHPTDGRSRSVALTPAGKRAYRRIRAATEDFRQRLLAAVGPEQADMLMRGLGRIADAMGPLAGASSAGVPRKDRVRG